MNSLLCRAWLSTVLQRGKAALWLCLAATPEMLKPGNRLPCASCWTSREVVEWHFSASQKSSRLLRLCPFLIWHIPCPEMEKGHFKYKRENFKLKSYFKEKLTCHMVGNSNSVFLWRAQSEGRDLWDISLMKRSSSRSPVSSQLWVRGKS